MKKLTGALFLTFIAASAATLLADAKIEFKTTEGTGSSMGTILVGHGKLRADGDANTAVILDPTAQVMMLIDHSKKTVTTMTKADFDQIAQLITMMDNMPPEARQMMAARAGGAGPASVTVDTGEKATVGGKSCRIFRTTQGTRTTQESCMADAALIDVSAADRATLNAALAWVKSITDAFAKAPMMGSVGNSIPFRAGLIPLRTTTFDDKGARTTSEFVGVSNGPIDAGMFGVPSGYKEQKMPMGRGRGGN